MNVRLRRGRVNNSRFHGVKDWFLHSEDAVTAAGGGRQRVKNMAAYFFDQVTTATLLPSMSGTADAGGGIPCGWVNKMDATLVALAGRL